MRKESHGRANRFPYPRGRKDSGAHRWHFVSVDAFGRCQVVNMCVENGKCLNPNPGDEPAPKLGSCRNWSKPLFAYCCAETDFDETVLILSCDGGTGEASSAIVRICDVRIATTKTVSGVSERILLLSANNESRRGTTIHSFPSTETDRRHPHSVFATTLAAV